MRAQYSRVPILHGIMMMKKIIPQVTKKIMIFWKKNIFEENNKEVQNILSEVVTKRSKYTYRIHNVKFIFWLFDTSLYRDTYLDKDFVVELKKAANEEVINNKNEKK